MLYHVRSVCLGTVGHRRSIGVQCWCGVWQPLMLASAALQLAPATKGQQWRRTRQPDKQTIPPLPRCQQGLTTISVQTGVLGSAKNKTAKSTQFPTHRVLHRSNRGSTTRSGMAARLCTPVLRRSCTNRVFVSPPLVLTIAAIRNGIHRPSNSSIELPAGIGGSLS